MLTHAGASVRELFPDILTEARNPVVAVRKAEQVEIIRRRRHELNQDVSFGARPFILCGLPIRSLPLGTLKYVRRNGHFFLEIVGHPDYGVPFGQDRLILLWLATMAVKQRSPVIRFDSAAEILVELGMPTNGSHYRRLQDAFRRVFASTLFFGTKDDLREAQVWDCSRGHFLDHMRLWFGKDAAANQAKTDNVVTLSPAFWHELSTHPIPVDTEVVRALANNSGCLDLYTWLTWRCYQANGTQRIPLFGPAGLASQLGVQEYARERKFRERIRQWLKLVQLCWPGCPATVSRNGAFLELHHAIAVTPSERR
ncbi:MAG: plasmid encoded RepA protein [Bryobacterales bacterium]|nr:plasmid encoded RepA protein [Bryobacterales bacterium]